MFAYLILLFTILPAIELAVLIKVGTHIGVGNTLTIIILTGVIGAYLARMQGFLVLQNIQKSLHRGEMPTEEMLDGVMIFVGGIVLLTPGFITDTLGFLLLIPPTRSLIKYWLKNRFRQSLKDGNITTSYPHYSPEDPFDDAEDADFR